MAEARPREKLSFNACRRMNYKADVRPLPLRGPTKEQAARLRELLAAVREQQQPIKKAPLSLAGYDEFYEQALKGGDGEEQGDSTEVITASLEFPRREDDR